MGSWGRRGKESESGVDGAHAIYRTVGVRPKVGIPGAPVHSHTTISNNRGPRRTTRVQLFGLQPTLAVFQVRPSVADRFGQPVLGLIIGRSCVIAEKSAEALG